MLSKTEYELYEIIRHLSFMSGRGSAIARDVLNAYRSGEITRNGEKKDMSIAPFYVTIESMERRGWIKTTVTSHPDHEVEKKSGSKSVLLIRPSGKCTPESNLSHKEGLGFGGPSSGPLPQTCNSLHDAKFYPVGHRSYLIP